MTLSLFNVFCRAARRAFQHVINSDSGGSSIAQYWLILLHLKKNDLPAALVGNDCRRWRYCVEISRVTQLLFRRKLQVTGLSWWFP